MNSANPGMPDAIENNFSSTEAQETGSTSTNRSTHGNRRNRSSRSVSGIYIAAMVVGFVFFWPIGLAMLAWALWRDQIKANPMVQKFMQGSMPTPPSMPNLGGLGGLMGRRSSNTALAEYLEQEQSRLKTEQHKLDELVKAFEAFKQAERQTADQRDFEEFLRRRESSGDTPTSG